jgi:phosphate transport system permease protein
VNAETTTKTASPQAVPDAKPAAAPRLGSRRSRTSRVVTSILAAGEPQVWLIGGGLVIASLMIVGLFGLILYQGLTTFWPQPVTEVELKSGDVFMGEIIRSETFSPEPEWLLQQSEPFRAAARQEMATNEGLLHRRLMRTGNYELTGEHFNWITDASITPQGESRPTWAVLFERLAWGRFYAVPIGFAIDGESVASNPDEIWRLYEQHHPDVRARFRQRRRLENRDIGRINHHLESARLALRGVELKHGLDSAPWQTEHQTYLATEREAAAQFALITEQTVALEAANDRYALTVRTADGTEQLLRLGDIVRAYPANQLGFWQKLGVYTSRWWEFLSDDPREANSEGGVFPAIFGTVVMTLIMSLLVVPFGVLAALYLREYAKAGSLVSAVRISINNLAGVPSIVFGVFGLGFFCYIIGTGIDQLFFSAKLPNPTYGTGGLLWASLTLALLTLPVVIVATEEALAAVPGSMREGSYACGASKWQTIQRIVLPRALPGIMTGAILAMARGAGEVAPLMLVGAVKLAPELPVDGIFPFVHAERSFMHLGFHIFDLGFQSQNSEAAKPMVFTTTLLLIVIITVLNLSAIWLRARLRRKYVSSHF